MISVSTLKLFLFISFSCVLVACGGSGSGSGSESSSQLSNSSNSISVSSSSHSSSTSVITGFQKPFILFSSKNINTQLAGYTLNTNDKGESLLAWSDINSKYMRVIAGVKLYKDGGYSPVYHFSNPDHLATSFDVSINNQGDVNFVWIDKEDVDGAIEQIWSRSISGSGDITPLARLDKLDSDPDIHGPKSLIFENGDAVVVWSQNRRLYSAFYKIGTGWTEPETIDEAIGNAISPVLGKDKYNNITVAWRQLIFGETPGYRQVVATNYFIADQGWAGVKYFKDSVKDFDNIVLTVSESGKAILGWTETGPAKNVYSSFFVPNVGWQEIKEHPIEKFLPAYKLTAKINSKDHAILGWKVGDNQLYVANYSPVSDWSEPKIFNADTNEKIGGYDLEIGESGIAMTAWSQGVYVTATYGNTVNLNIATYDPRLGWGGHKTIISNPSTGGYGNPRIVLVEGANIFVAWGEVTDMLEERIWISRYFE